MDFVDIALGHMDPWILEQLGHVDPQDPAPGEDAVVPQVDPVAIMLNPIDDELEEEELEPHQHADEEDNEEEDPEEDLEDDFWVAHPGGDNPFVWQPAVADTIELELPEDWYTADDTEEDQPVVYQLFQESTPAINPLQKAERALTQLAEERDALLQQQAVDWGRITELEEAIAQLQGEQQALKQQHAEYASMTDKAVELLVVRIDQEMSLANREEQLHDHEFSAYVEMLQRRRSARQHTAHQRQLSRGSESEGSSRHDD